MHLFQDLTILFRVRLRPLLVKVQVAIASSSSSVAGTSSSSVVWAAAAVSPACKKISSLIFFWKNSTVLCQRRCCCSFPRPFLCDKLLVCLPFLRGNGGLFTTLQVHMVGGQRVLSHDKNTRFPRSTPTPISPGTQKVFAVVSAVTPTTLPPLNTKSGEKNPSPTFWLKAAVCK